MVLKLLNMRFPKTKGPKNGPVKYQLSLPGVMVMAEIPQTCLTRFVGAIKNREITDLLRNPCTESKIMLRRKYGISANYIYAESTAVGRMEVA